MAAACAPDDHSDPRGRTAWLRRASPDPGRRGARSCKPQRAMEPGAPAGVSATCTPPGRTWSRLGSLCRSPARPPLESGQGGRGTEGETGQKTAWRAHDRIGATNARVALKWQDLAASLGARQARIQDSGDREDPSERRGARPVASAAQSSPASSASTVDSSGVSPLSARSRLIRSTIGGWVEKSPFERSSNFLIGFVK